MLRHLPLGNKYPQIPKKSRIEFQNLNVSRLDLQLSLPNSLTPGEIEYAVGAAPTVYEIIMRYVLWRRDTNSFLFSKACIEWRLP